MTTPDAVPPFRFVRGTRPVLLSIPHVGTHLPEALRGDYTDAALQLADTDWHLDRLYAVVHQLGTRCAAIQLELCQCLYMDEPSPFGYRPDLAARLQPTLTAMLGAAADALGALAT